MPQISLPLKKNYLKLIENSVGSKMFRDCFDKNKNLTESGRLSCAFFVSSVLYLCGLIPKVHLSVKGVLKDMKKAGWFEIKHLKKGSVILWEKREGHYHLGFYIGNKKAISNSSKKKTPIVHHFIYQGRKIEKIFWHKKLNNSSNILNTIKEP